MTETGTIRGIIFDYGGTIDTNGRHWAEVLWEQYTMLCVPITKEQFREAYVFAERYLAQHRVILPEHNFLDVLLAKVNLQLQYLAIDESQRQQLAMPIAQQGYDVVLKTLTITRPVVEELSQRYPLVLVSNFYGNIHTILEDFRLASLFTTVIESAIVGVRKPNPQIFQLGLDALQLPAESTLVVGDSFTKDILPAHTLHCQTAWLKGEAWDSNASHDTTIPNLIITSLDQLPTHL